MKIETLNLFNLDETIAKKLLAKKKYPWECLPEIHDFIIELGKTLDKNIFEQRGNNIWIAKTAIVAPTVSITGPAIIDEYAELRHCAFIRRDAIVGKNVVVGNSTELKNCILFNEVQVPHFNYVADSILGYKSHIGASVITANLRSDKSNVIIKNKNLKNIVKIETNMRKVGAFLGDGVEIGCNSVLNPGTIIGKNTSIYPCSSLNGIIQENSIYKNQNEIIKKKNINF